jgi:DNA-binding response OmpR family regulator
MQVLIVEGAPGLPLVAGALRSRGVGVSVAHDGPSALALAERREYDVVILGLATRGLDGFEVLEEVGWRTPSSGVLVVSTDEDLKTRLTAFALGASDFVQAPFSLDEMLARVRVQLRRRGGHAGHVIRAGAVELDLTRREARVGQRVAPLTDREFRLLQYLIEHVGEVVSREDLLAQVWQDDFEPHSNVVDVCIGRLRKKLDPYACLETVRNAGYRLDDSGERGADLDARYSV